MRFGYQHREIRRERRSLLSLLCLLTLMLLFSIPMRASAEPSPTAPHLSQEAQMSLITVLPGDQVHSLFGHSALRVQDPAQGIDEVYNYGTFDFSDPFFIPKFMHGQLDYFLSSQSAHTLPLYVEREGRPVIEQVLNLSHEQMNILYGFLGVNAMPENRYYRYDFLFDNCSTRILDALEDNLTGEVDFTRDDPPQESFRSLLEPYLIEQPFLHGGIDLLLGAPTDRIATPREAAFLPDHLMYLFDDASVQIDGEWMSLVAETDTLEWVSGYERAQPAIPWATVFAWVILVGVVLVSFRLAYEGSLHGDLLTRVFDAFLFGLAGLMGLIICYLWFISEHNVTNQNFNLLWAWPTHLIIAVAFLRSVASRWFWMYLGLTALVTGLFVLLLPFVPQVLPGFVLPLALALVIRSAAAVYVQRRDLAELQPVSG